MLQPWTHNDQEVSDETIEGFTGYVYLIENLLTGRKYIGKKLFTKAKTRQVKKKKKHIRVASDWRTYCGSNVELLDDFALAGEQNFKRTILHLCKSKGDCSYMEAKEQFAADVLRSPLYYNSFVGCKIHRRHVTALVSNK